MATVQVSCTTAYGKKTKTVSVSKFAGLDNPRDEAKLYLRLWSIAKKLEDANETDPEKLKLNKNERAALARSPTGYISKAGTATPAEYIAMRRSSTDVGVDGVDNGGNNDGTNIHTSTEHTEQVPDNMRRPNNLADVPVASTAELVKDSATGDLIEMPAIDYTEFELMLPDLSETGHTLVLFGASKSGKTTLLKKILKKPDIADDDNIKIIVSPNIHARIYQDIDKKIIRMSRWDDRLIRALHKIQKKTKNKFQFTVIIDDCITEKNSKKIMELFLTLRNSKISTIMLLQSTTLLNRNSRFNTNNLVFLKNNNDEANDQNMKFFLGSYQPFKKLKRMEDKVQLYRDITNNYGFVYLNALDGEMSFHKGN